MPDWLLVAASENSTEWLVIAQHESWSTGDSQEVFNDTCQLVTEAYSCHEAGVKGYETKSIKCGF